MSKRFGATVFALPVIGFAIICSTATATAQTAKDFVGTWTMASHVNTQPDGSKVDVFGPKGTGMAIFESNGHFVMIVINPDTPKFASNIRTQGTPEEYKAAVLGGTSFYGTYSVSNKVVSLKVEGSTDPNWIGTEQKRNVSTFVRDEFKFTFAGALGGTNEATWRRIE
jgi:hypothetical protein